jgi:hypothetical protein
VVFSTANLAAEMFCIINTFPRLDIEPSPMQCNKGPKELSIIESKYFNFQIYITHISTHKNILQVWFGMNNLQQQPTERTENEISMGPQVRTKVEKKSVYLRRVSTCSNQRKQCGKSDRLSEESKSLFHYYCSFSTTTRSKGLIF